MYGGIPFADRKYRLVIVDVMQLNIPSVKTPDVRVLVVDEQWAP